MLSQYYIKQQNKKRFAEKFPITGVKCTFCDLIYPVNKIEQHMNSHISPHYMVPYTKQNNIKKMEIHKFLIDDKENQNLAASLKTVYPEDLPCRQTVRRQIALPPYIIHTQQKPHPHGRSFSTQAVKVDRKDVASNLNLDYANNQKQFINLLNIQKPVSLNIQTTKLQKKTIQTYQKQIGSKKIQNMDQEKVKKKFFSKPQRQTDAQQTKISSDKNSINQNIAYKVEQFKQNKNGFSLRMKQDINSKKENESKLSIPIKRLRSPEPKFLAISTKSESLKNLNTSNNSSFFGSFFKKQKVDQVKNFANTNGSNGQNMSTASNFFKLNQNSYNNSSTNGFFKNNQCPDCGGFYCGTCKSTIPPQYRPVNQLKGNQNLQTKSFYNTHFTSRRKCQMSLLNEKPSCQDCNK